MVKLRQKITPKAFTKVYQVFLSEEKDAENLMCRFIQAVFSSQRSIESNYSNPDILMLEQVSRKVHREKHRMEAFVRFQLTKDNLYYAIVQPDFNVLPLIIKHFKNRYQDQQWLIYDVRRKYGIYYDLNIVSEVTIDFIVDQDSQTSLAGLYDENENLYQELWRQYFKSVNIAARKNTRLHIQHMPKRYWKYLTEKK
jgi:probable DNA metabolism protein